MRVWNSHYEAGKWKAVCQRCGFDFKNTDLRLEWTGLRVCSECLDQRHPQEFLKGVPDRQAPPWVSPPGPETDSAPIFNPEDIG